ncbi:MAG TPA: lyase family protein [Nocardioidaceae bacterium]|nr:lyase family protein [Nocardioidaceae bacterium]
MSRPGDDGLDVADTGLLSPVVAGTAVERLTGDRAVVAAMVRMEAALLRALVSTGIAPAEAAKSADAVASVDPDVRELALAAAEGGNPAIPLVRQLRAAVDPEQAEWVHHGATSQDVVDTALALVASEVARQLEQDLLRLGDSLARLADEHRALPVVARTLTQQALPTTLGMRVSGWLAGVDDAVLLLRGCTPLPVSIGGPVGTASAYDGQGPAVADALAAELDLAAPVVPWHTRRTPVTELGHALATAVAACAKVAADVLVMAQQEVGELREGRGGPSSAMRHKANPAQSVLVASAGRQAPALASVLLSSAVAEQERPAGAWHAEWQPLRALLRLAGGAAERTVGIVEGLVLDSDAMRRNLEHLRDAVGEDDRWVERHTGTVGVWVDRSLARHQEVRG